MCIRDRVELRSKNPFGPYEEYVGMAQGKNKKVNGPHQGAWAVSYTHLIVLANPEFARLACNLRVVLEYEIIYEADIDALLG